MPLIEDCLDICFDSLLVLSGETQTAATDHELTLWESFYENKAKSWMQHNTQVGVHIQES